jgi:hypothetical protein
MASRLAEGEGGHGRAGPVEEFAAKRRRCPVQMSGAVSIELQLDVSPVVVSVTVAVPVEHFRAPDLASLATFIKYSS